MCATLNWTNLSLNALCVLWQLILAKSADVCLSLSLSLSLPGCVSQINKWKKKVGEEEEMTWPRNILQDYYSSHCGGKIQCWSQVLVHSTSRVLFFHAPVKNSVIPTLKKRCLGQAFHLVFKTPVRRPVFHIGCLNSRPSSVSNDSSFLMHILCSSRRWLEPW